MTLFCGINKPASVCKWNPKFPEHEAVMLTTQLRLKFSSWNYRNKYFDTWHFLHTLSKSREFDFYGGQLIVYFVSWQRVIYIYIVEIQFHTDILFCDVDNLGYSTYLIWVLLKQTVGDLNQGKLIESSIHSEAINNVHKTMLSLNWSPVFAQRTGKYFIKAGCLNIRYR